MTERKITKLRDSHQDLMEAEMHDFGNVKDNEWAYKMEEKIIIGLCIKYRFPFVDFEIFEENF